MNLVIVESPTKARTIGKFLGKDYAVESSFGHIRDLPKSEMGIDIEHNFEPKYVVPQKNNANIKKLRDLAKRAENVILATDEDREGEAIAWHLLEGLKLKEKDCGRIVFHEITKDAILAALAKPRRLDMDLVDAQQARRVLDRLVGYELSPFLWKKVARGLSAGRVQSVAVRLVVEREREILAFKPDEYWSVEADFAKIGSNKTFRTSLNKINNKAIGKLQINNKEMADKVLADLNAAKFSVANIEKKETMKKPPIPFTTSTLQQAANRMLGFSAKQTMRLAQQLYEGMDLGGDSGGLITYMRTDSLNLSEKFIGDAREYVGKNLGAKYVPEKAPHFKTKSKGAQEAHEAIRPTEASRTPESLKDKLDDQQYKLYKLIWQRSVACQMQPALFNATAIDIAAETATKTDKYQFRATGQTMVFDGYLAVYPEQSTELELPVVEKKEALDLKKLNAEQHFTKAPGRYSDAGLVKKMEEHGIGRPSTYAPTISTIIDRNYVNRDDAKKLFPTPIAFVVIDMLVNHFQNIVDFKFTAEMEDNLDRIAKGKMKWQPVIREFYEPFHANLEQKTTDLKKTDVIPEEKSEEVCEKCGAPMIIKTGRYGKYLACSGYPDCKNIKSIKKEGEAEETPEKAAEREALEAKYKDQVCDKCGSPMALKNGRFGPFLACTKYPKCKNIKSIKENSSSTGITCPICGKGTIVAKRSRRGTFYACDAYPDCKTSFATKPTGAKCPTCQSLLVENPKGGLKCSAKDCGYTE